MVPPPFRYNRCRRLPSSQTASIALRLPISI
jgi:hypothetical protein